ncbi:MAG: aldolase/citrate lyase family protein [SAR202 cluster bacterium]|jgi:4-hydroxy-2-oxoheptanedioate aldolase|nr:aldolase/citrate lyase family protein [SAR202 cluster bacterium]MDP6299877.1 aldolase/citrate lyase family protein [SAR202 cluster bacterium]MDP7102224.1 aldolase/citrate lyase family protein [SAR202 cluster bacterium]MDP7223985.1 aldolase/citrate lyase family protein [SAR202 cluster bacterium]MDP7414251.1 aldolase/citrate lyase family protein [SAR202 cluster bacterium]
MAQIRENRVKAKLQRGEIATLLMGDNSSPNTVDAQGPLGFDSVLIEGEHGSVDFGDIPNLTRACDLWGMTSVVRVNVNQPGVIYRTLDVGAQGVMVPHINTKEEAQAVVEATKFAPIGARGMSNGRQGHGVAEYVHQANDHTFVTILIEDIVAIDNLAEIVTVDHIDVFYVAPGDLAQSMGLTGQTSHPDVLAAVDRGIATIVDSGRIAGMLVSDSTVDDYLAKGVRYVGIPWTGWLNTGAKSFLDGIASRAG